MSASSLPACIFASIFVEGAALVGDVQPRPGAFFKQKLRNLG